jgi:hypothetical protein
MKKPLTFREFEPALWTLCDSNVQPLSHPGPLIPSQAIALRMRLAVIDHTVPGIHYSKDLTLRTLKAKYYWNELQENVDSICAS